MNPAGHKVQLSNVVPPSLRYLPTKHDEQPVVTPIKPNLPTEH